MTTDDRPPDAPLPTRPTPNLMPPGWTAGSPYLMVVVALFVTSLIAANTVAVKILEVGPFVSDAGIITFPLVYIVGDVLTEVYGYAVARRVIWLGFLCNAIAVGTFQLAGALPAEATWDGGAAYARIFDSTPRLLLASFAAYLVGEFANSYILARLKVATEGRFLWLRTISSTMVGQGLDTTVFVILAFAGTAGMTSTLLRDMVITGWLLKTAYEALATPLTYLVVNTLKRRESLDVYDRGTDFNPLAVGS